MIKDKLLEVFSKLYKEEFGVDLPKEERAEIVSRLLYLYKSIFGNLPESCETKENGKE